MIFLFHHFEKEVNICKSLSENFSMVPVIYAKEKKGSLILNLAKWNGVNVIFWVYTTRAI